MPEIWQRASSFPAARSKVAISIAIAAQSSRPTSHFLFGQVHWEVFWFLPMGYKPIGSLRRRIGVRSGDDKRRHFLSIRRSKRSTVYVHSEPN